MKKCKIEKYFCISYKREKEKIMPEKATFNKFNDLSFQEAQITHNILRDGYESEHKFILDNKKQITYILIIYIGMTGYFLWAGEIDINTIRISWMWTSGIMGFMFAALSASISIDLFRKVKNVIYFSKEGKTLEKSPALFLVQQFFSRRSRIWDIWSFSILLMPAFLLATINIAIWLLIAFSFSKWVGIASTMLVATAARSFFIWYKKWCSKHLQTHKPFYKGLKPH
jgi:hypothetical protein